MKLLLTSFSFLIIGTALAQAPKYNNERAPNYGPGKAQAKIVKDTAQPQISTGEAPKTKFLGKTVTTYTQLVQPGRTLNFLKNTYVVSLSTNYQGRPVEVTYSDGSTLNTRQQSTELIQAQTIQAGKTRTSADWYKREKQVKKVSCPMGCTVTYFVTSS